MLSRGDLAESRRAESMGYRRQRDRGLPARSPGHAAGAQPARARSRPAARIVNDWLDPSSVALPAPFAGGFTPFGARANASARGTALVSPEDEAARRCSVLS